MCFAKTYNKTDLEALDQCIFDNVPFNLYGRGCWLISRIVQSVMGFPMKCIGIYSIQRGGVIPHWVNIMPNGGVVDLKRRCFLKNCREPILPEWTDDGNHFVPAGREYKNVTRDLSKLVDPQAMWAEDQHELYMRFVENNTLTEFIKRGWLNHYNRVVDKWFATMEC